MSIAELLTQYSTEIMVAVFGMITVMLATMNNRTDDRGLELKMQGMYLQASASDREELKTLRGEVRGLSQTIAQQALTIVESKSNAVQLETKLNHQQRGHELEIKSYLDRIARLETDNELLNTKLTGMNEENTTLRTKVSDLTRQVGNLQKRIEEVAKTAAQNADLLEKERQLREKIETERDQLIVERDALVIAKRELTEKVDRLEKALEMAQQRVTDQEGVIQQLRIDLDELKTKLSEGKQDETSD